MCLIVVEEEEEKICRRSEIPWVEAREFCDEAANNCWTPSAFNPLSCCRLALPLAEGIPCTNSSMKSSQLLTERKLILHKEKFLPSSTEELPFHRCQFRQFPTSWSSLAESSFDPFPFEYRQIWRQSATSSPVEMKRLSNQSQNYWG